MIVWILLLLPFFSAEASITLSRQDWISRLQSIDLLNDHEMAVEMADTAIKANPQNLDIYVLAMRIYAHAADEKKMVQLVKCFQNGFPQASLPRDLLEELAWGIIQKGACSSTPITRALALISGAMSNDAKGVSLLAEHLEDPHRVVRLLSVEFASQFRDAKLQETVLKRLQLEKDYEVRVNLLKAVGAMHVSEAKPLLFQVLESGRSTAEEKAAAMISLVDLYDTVGRQEIERFSKHPLAALRSMSTALIQHNERIEDADLLIPLLTDSQPEVRRSAVEVLGGMRLKSLSGYPAADWIKPLIQDINPEVSITAAWALMLATPEDGQASLKPWLKSRTAEERLYASAALAAAGMYGFPLTMQSFQETQDDNVKINLGLALIRQGIDPAAGADAIYSVLSNKNVRLMTKKMGRFETVAHCKVAFRADIPNYPEVVNQTTRLELLNQLALLHHPKAQEAIQSFLQERPWGVSGAASALLLTEGDEEALQLIRNLLNDPSEKIRMQAALILGLWGSDAEALSTLQVLYPAAGKAKKEQILEALGRIGDHSALPFLLHCLEEPHASLRIIAASAILQTLYH